jgi:hypothetical protein
MSGFRHVFLPAIAGMAVSSIEILHLKYLSFRLGDVIEQWEPIVVFITFVIAQAIAIPRRERWPVLLGFCLSFWVPFNVIVVALLFVYPTGLSETPTITRALSELLRLMLLVPLPCLLLSTAAIRSLAWIADWIRRSCSRAR